MKKFIYGFLAIAILMVAVTSNIQAAEQPKGSSSSKDEQTKETLIMMYWELYSRLQATLAELGQYKTYYPSAYVLAQKEYTTTPSLRVLKVVVSASSTCDTCEPFLDVSWRASNVPAIRLDLISTTSQTPITLSTSTPNDGKETVRLSVPDDQPDGKYFLVITSAEGNSSSVGKTKRQILTLANGVATISPYTLKSAFKLIEAVAPQDPTKLRAEADAKYRAENPKDDKKKSGSSKDNSEEEEDCSTTDKILHEPGCFLAS